MDAIPGLCRGLLYAAYEPGGPGRGHAVEAVHSIDGRGMGVSDREGRAEDSADLAPERRPSEGTYPDLFPGLCDVEDAGTMDAAFRAGHRTEAAVGRAGENQEWRRCAAASGNGNRAGSRTAS